MVEVNLTARALERLKEKGFKTFKLEVVEETYEWTPCCGIGDACVTVPRVKVKGGEGGLEDVKFHVEGVTIYVEPKLLSMVEGGLTIDVNEFGELDFKGLRLNPSFTIRNY
ncbi:MAG: hypothetical protein QXK12_00825 [Candidatus Nezhaarchaeales archaeon]